MNRKLNSPEHYGLIARRLFEKLAAKHDLQHADPVLATEGADE